MRVCRSIAFLVAAVAVPCCAFGQAIRQKQVLVLVAARRDAQFAVVAERKLPSLLRHGMTEGVDYYSEYIDAPRFEDREYRTAFRDFLRLKYKAQRIDLVITVGSVAIEFMASNRELLFPGSPVVFYALTPPNVRMANSTGLVNELHLRRSLDLAVTLQPDLEHVFVVSGAGATDRTYEQQARREFLLLETCRISCIR
jgi:hypothetical protein